MKIAVRLVTVLFAAGLGLAVGLAIRARRVAPAASAALSPTPEPAPRPLQFFTNSSERLGAHRKDDSPLATQLARDLAKATGVTRWLYCFEALERAAPSDFPRLYRLLQENPVAARLVETRWVEVAPRQLFDLVVAGPDEAHGLPLLKLAHVLFDEWPRRDPDAAIAALNDTRRVGADDNWRWTAAYSLIENDVERSLRLMLDWHTDNVGLGPRGIKAVTKWSRADPRHAAEFVLGLSDGYSFRSTMETIGSEWARVDPIGALDFASARPGELASQLATHALQGWVGRDVAGTEEWLARADDRTRRRLGPAFAEALAKQDPAGAVAWCEEHLTGSALRQSIASAVGGVAERNVANAAALVGEMNPSAARAEAAVTVAQKWFPDLASDQRATPEAVAWLSRLDPDSLRRVMDRIAWRWATSDAPGMAAFLVESSSDQISSHAFTVAARELARRNPAEALAWASRLTGDTSLSAGGAAFGEWQSSQPEAALRWLNEMPASDPRRQSYFESGIRELAYHPQVDERLLAMNAQQRAAARSVIETMNLPEDRRARLLSVLQAR